MLTLLCRLLGQCLNVVAIDPIHELIPLKGIEGQDSIVLRKVSVVSPELEGLALTFGSEFSPSEAAPPGGGHHSGMIWAPS